MLVEQVALNKQLTGNMLRIIYLCATKERNQTELSRLLQTNISNISAAVKVLTRMQLLHKNKIDGVVLYSVNWDWDNNTDPNQITLQDII